MLCIHPFFRLYRIHGHKRYSGIVLNKWHIVHCLNCFNRLNIFTAYSYTINHFQNMINATLAKTLTGSILSIHSKWTGTFTPLQNKKCTFHNWKSMCRTIGNFFHHEYFTFQSPLTFFFPAPKYGWLPDKNETNLIESIGLISNHKFFLSSVILLKPLLKNIS